MLNNEQIRELMNLEGRLNFLLSECTDIEIKRSLSSAKKFVGSALDQGLSK